MDSKEKLLLITNRTREAAFASLRRSKEALYLHKVHPEWMTLPEVERMQGECKELFKKWKALRGKLEEGKENENLQLTHSLRI